MLNFAKQLSAALDALRRHAILFLLAVAVIAVALLTRSYLDARDATARLQATLAAQQKTISDADQRQSTRDAQLSQTLAQISAAKQKVQTPTQAATALPGAVSQLIAEGPSGHPLPSPITIELPQATGSANPTNSSAPDAHAPQSDSVARVLEPGAVPTANSGSPSPNGTSVIPNTGTTTAKYPWTALKLELEKLGLVHASPAKTSAGLAKSDLENREGSAAAQKGSSAQGTPSTQSSANGSSNARSPGNNQTQSTSNSQSNSPPTGANGNATSTGNLPPGDATSAAAQDNSAPLVGTNGTAQSGAPPAIIRVPQDDLKPLYDAVQDCRACQAKLTVAQADLSDERTKFAAATAQRDAAIRAARGTFWKRTRTAAKWIAIGAAAGALVARYH